MGKEERAPKHLPGAQFKCFTQPGSSIQTHRKITACSSSLRRICYKRALWLFATICFYRYISHDKRALKKNFRTFYAVQDCCNVNGLLKFRIICLFGCIRYIYIVCSIKEKHLDFGKHKGIQDVSEIDFDLLFWKWLPCNAKMNY